MRVYKMVKKRRNWEQYYRYKCADLEAQLMLLKKRLQRMSDNIQVKADRKSAKYVGK